MGYCNIWWDLVGGVSVFFALNFFPKVGHFRLFDGWRERWKYVRMMELMSWLG